MLPFFPAAFCGRGALDAAPGGGSPPVPFDETGSLLGYTVAATPSVSRFVWGASTPAANGPMASFDLNGVTLELFATDTDGYPPYEPTGNVVQLVSYASLFGSGQVPALASIISAINAKSAPLGFTASEDSDGRLVFTSDELGAGAAIVGLSEVDPVNWVQAFSDTPGTEASGEVQQVELVAGVPGQVLTIESVTYEADATNGYERAVEIGWLHDDLTTFTGVGEITEPGPGGAGSVSLSNTTSPAGASLIARNTTSPATLNSALSITVEGTAES